MAIKKLKKCPDLETWMRKPTNWQAILKACDSGPMAATVWIPEIILLVPDKVPGKPHLVHVLARNLSQIILFVGLQADEVGEKLSYDPSKGRHVVLATFPPLEEGEPSHEPTPG